MYIHTYMYIFFFAPDNNIMELIYPPATITSNKGKSLKLSCEACNDFQRFSLLHVVCSQNDAELTNRRSN